MKTENNGTSGAHSKKSKLDSFSLDFEYNRTLREERQKTKQRAVSHQ